MTGELFQNSEPLANYNYSELSSSIGWINFYGVVGSNPVNRILTTQAWNSDPLYTNCADGTEYDFDTLINKQIVVSGKTQISIPWYAYRGVAGTGYFTFTIYLRKYVGGVETDIVSSSAPEASVAGTGYGAGYSGVILDIPETIYRRGDILRITIKCVFNGISWVHTYHDPKDSEVYTAGTGVYGAFRVPIPTKINL